MIKVNLAPFEELENPYWWIPDAIAFALVLSLGVYMVDTFLEDTRNQIIQVTQERDRVQESIRNMQADVDRHKSLTKKITELDEKRNTLHRITESKLVRFLPIIVMEHLQNLKPDGVWLTRAVFGKIEGGAGQAPAQAPPPNPNDQGETPEGAAPQQVDMAAQNSVIEVTGYSFDNIILAEFMSALKASKNTDVDPSDVRTQVYFDRIDIEYSEATEVQRKVGDKVEPYEVTRFKITFVFRERDAGADAINGDMARYIESLQKEVKL